MISRIALAATAALLLVGDLENGLQGAEREPLRYRRILVPQEELESQIRGLLPMRRDEFDRRIEQAAVGVSGSIATARARIEHAVYAARLDGETLVAGKGELTIAVSGAGPHWLRLAPCNLALDDPRWDEGRMPAVIGQTPQGELAGLVERSGRLDLGWSLRGKSLAGGAVQFQLQLPPALSSTITIELPADQSLVATDGLVMGGEPAAGKSDRKLWRVDVGGRGWVQLTVQPTGAVKDTDSIIGVRETSTYSLYGSALDLQAVLDLNLFEQRADPLKLRIDRPLELATIRSGEQSFNWRTLESDESSMTVAVDDLAAMNGGKLTLEINATAPWSPDPPANLPRLTVVDGLYQEGSATVVAPNWLRVQARPLRSCWQSAVVSAAPGRNVDQLQFHLQEPAAVIEVATDSSQLRLHEISGTQITIDASYISAVATTEVSAVGGERYQVEAHIPRRWLIDAVDVAPAEDVSDRLLTPGDGAMQVLRLNLRTPLSADRRLRVTIRARQRRPAGAQSLSGSFFRVASFSHVRDAERLVAIRTTDPSIRLQLSVPDGSLRLDPGTLPESQMKLFETPPGSVLFDDSANSAAVTANLTRAPVRYRAEILMETRVNGKTLHEAMRLRCLPDASAIGQVLVRLSPRPTGSVTWSMVGGDRRALEVESVAAEAEAEDGMYRLRLTNPRAEPFELRGEWSRSVVSSADLVLASAPEASTQSGIVEVHAIDATPLDLSPDDLQPQLVPSGPFEQWTTLRGRYLYEPGRRIRPRLALVSPNLAPAAAVVTSLIVESRFDGRGYGEHEVALEIENRGLRQLQMRLPLAARDTRQLNAFTGKTSPVLRLSPELIAIDLPAGERRNTVYLRYRSEDSPLGWKPVGQLAAPLVSTDVPVLKRRWNVSIAPGLAFVAGHRSQDSISLASRLWPRSFGTRIANLTAVAHPPVSTNAMDRAFQGWSSTTTSLSTGDAATIDVYQPDVIQGIALAALLGATGVALLLRRSSRWLITAALLVLSAALLQGPTFDPVLFGVAAGLFVGAATRLFWPCARQLASAGSDASARVRMRGLSLLLCLAASGLAAGFTASAIAQQAPSREQQATDERVVIPVDANQQPSGDYVFLSPQLYERLQSLNDEGAARLPAWLITEAHYSLPGTARESGGAASIDEILARFEVQALHAPTTVELPVRRDQVVLLEGRARLDGAPAQLTWRSDGAALLLSIDTDGPHRLELAFGAPAKKNNNGALLDLTIPPISRSTVATRGLTEPPPTILSRQGGPLEEVSAVGPQMALGPVGKLTALWPPSADKESAARLEAEQLLWWTLRPGSVVVEGKFKFRPVGGAIQHVSIAVDPRLRLLPGTIRPTPVRSWIEEGSPSVLHLELAESTVAEVSIYGSWLWIGASGTGNLLLPPIQARADRLVRAWCGVSAEQPLAVTAQQPATGHVRPEDFLIAWSEPAAEPALAVDELASGAPLQVGAQLAASQPTVVHFSNWSFRDGRAVLHLEAQLTQVPANRYQQRLELPPPMKVSRVEIMAEGKPIPLRWDQRADGTLVVTHLASPPTEQELRIDAEVRLGNRERWTLPQPQFQNALTASRVCRIYRQEDMLVQLSQAGGWLSEESALVSGRSDQLGRLVASLRTDDPVSKPLSVELAFNQPIIKGTLVVRVAEDEGAWAVDADLAIRITSGLVDAVRLEVPPEWSGPFKITPAVEHRIRPVPGSTTQELTIWPQQAASESLHLSIQAPLRAADGQAVRAPSIFLAGAESLDRLVLLDARFGGDQLRWETTGLQAIPAAAATIPPAWLSRDVEVFRAVADRYEATPLALRRDKLEPKIELVETTVIAQPGDRVLNQTTFFINPEGVTDFAVSLPAGSRLASLTMNGQVALCRAVGLRLWRVASPAPRVPLQIQVVYDSPLPSAADDGSIHLQQAQIQGFTPRRTVWQLSGLSPSALAKGQQVATEIDAELIQLEAAASALATLAGTPPGDLPTASIAAAWRYWSPQFESADQRLKARSNGDLVANAQQTLRRDAANKNINELARKLVQSGVLPREDLATELDGEPAILTAGERRQVIVIGQGTAEAQRSVNVQREQPSVAANWNWVYAAMAAFAALGVVMLGHFSVLRSVSATQPFLLLALSGLAWWLLAPLPWLGWIAVGAGVWLSLRSPWVRRTSDASHFANPRPALR